MIFEAFRQRFLEGLERRLGDLAVLARGCPHPDMLMRAFRYLAGVSGTYGSDGVTMVSRECESLCVTAAEEQRTLTQLERALLSAVIEGADQYAMSSSSRPK